MLQTHTIDPEDPASSAGQALYTITAGGFSATADAFARDEQTEASGSSRWSAPDGAQGDLGVAPQAAPGRCPHHQGRGRDGASRRLPAVHHPDETIGTWTTKIARLPATGGWHALVYTKTAEYGFEKDSFLLLAQSEEDAPALHHRFLDKRSRFPSTAPWAGWLWSGA